MDINVLHKTDWLEIINKNDDEIEINIDGVIGGDPWEEDDIKNANTKEKMRNELKSIGNLEGKVITVNINSYGGDVNHGLAIHDLLASNKATIITDVTGLTASAATIIAEAGDIRKISDNALFLAHKASAFLWGNSNELRESINNLDVIDNLILNIYAKRAGENGSKEDIKKLINKANGNGIWLSANEAKEYGLVDEVYEPRNKKKQNRKELNVIFNKIGIPCIPDDKLNTNDMNEKERSTMMEDLQAFVKNMFKKKDEQDDYQTQINDRLSAFEGTLKELENENAGLKAGLGKEKQSVEKLTNEKGQLESNLAKAKGKSTSVQGIQGQEDGDDFEMSKEDKATLEDMGKIQRDITGEFNN